MEGWSSLWRLFQYAGKYRKPLACRTNAQGLTAPRRDASNVVVSCNCSHSFCSQRMVQVHQFLQPEIGWTSSSMQRETFSLSHHIANIQCMLTLFQKQSGSLDAPDIMAALLKPWKGELPTGSALSMLQGDAELIIVAGRYDNALCPSP